MPTAHEVPADIRVGHVGSATVNLQPEGQGTLLSYVATSQVGGKLAQVGSRLIEGAARKVADDFFARSKAF